MHASSMSNELNQFMTASEVARRLRLSAERVRQLARSGRLPPDQETTLGTRLWKPETIERFAATRGRWGRFDKAPVSPEAGGDPETSAEVQGS